MQVESSTSGQKLGVPKSVKKKVYCHGELSKSHKLTLIDKWKAYADRLMLGEVLDLSEGLPQDLSEQWIALGPVPKGKRCMAVTFASTRTSKKGRGALFCRCFRFSLHVIYICCIPSATNTILLARMSGRPLSRHLVPALPADCVLDCIYSENQAILYILDVLRWKSQSLVECDAEFR